MFKLPFSSLADDAILQLASEKLKANPEEWEREIWQFVLDWLNPAINSIRVSTSGSTGSPKVISHSKQAMLESATLTCRALQMHKGDTALLCLPITKIGGMMMLVRSVFCRLDLYCIKPSVTPLQQLSAETKLNFAAFTPMQLHSATKNYGQFKLAESIDKIILGGEAISAEVLQLVTRLENAVYATFGMTETISHIALKRLNGINPDKHFKVLGDVKIATGDENRLVIEAPGLGQPYLVTNDVVEVISTTEFDWLGRTDNVINSGGVKIHPEEIEQQLQPNIQPAFFIGQVPDVRTGQKLVLAIEMTVLSESDMKELSEIFAKLEKLQRPKSVLLINRFVRTPNGKIKRHETLQRPAEEVVIR